MSVLKNKRHLARSEFERVYQQYYEISKQHFNKAAKRRQKSICEPLKLINNNIYNDVMTLQEILNKKKEKYVNQREKIIQNIFIKIQILERQIMVYSNITKLPFDKQALWVDPLNQEIELLNKLTQKPTNFQVNILDWTKIKNFKTLNTISYFHRYVHGKVLRATNRLKNGEDDLVLNLIDETFYCTVKANIKIPENKEEFEIRQGNLERAIQCLNEIERPLLCFFNLMEYSNRIQKEYGKMLTKLNKMLNGIINSDKKRFKK